MDTSKVVVLSLALGIPLVLMGVLFSHGESPQVTKPMSQIGLQTYGSQYGGKTRRKRRNAKNKSRKH